MSEQAAAGWELSETRPLPSCSEEREEGDMTSEGPWPRARSDLLSIESCCLLRDDRPAPRASAALQASSEEAVGPAPKRPEVDVSLRPRGEGIGTKF